MTKYLPDAEITKHDSIIKSMESILTKKGYLVKTNPSNTKQNGVSRNSEVFYPDVYVYEIRSSGLKTVVTQLYEVETELTTTDEEAKDQWKRYSEGKSDFYLVVPKTKLDIAKELVKKYNIQVKNYFTY